MIFFMENAYSIIFFILQLFTIIILSNSASKKKGIAAKGLLICLVLAYSLPCGLRGIHVGLDTENYYYLINNIENYNPTIARYEVGFRILIQLLKIIFINPTLVMLSLSVIINTIIVCSFWKLKDKFSFTILNLGFLIFYYFQTYNIMRQWLAIAIILYMVTLLFDKKYIKSILLVLLATTMHKTGIIALLLVCIFWIENESKTIFKKIIIIIAAMTALVSFDKITKLFMGNNELVYLSERYFSNNNNDAGIIGMFFYLRLLFLLILTLSYIYKKVSLTRLSEEFLRIIIVCYSLGIGITMLGYFFKDMERTGSYFIIFELFIYEILLTKTKNKIVHYAIIGIFILIFIQGLLSSGQGQFPFYLQKISF